MSFDNTALPHTARSDTIFSRIYLLVRVRYLNLIEGFEITVQMGQYIIFLSLKPATGTSVFILNYLKKNIGGTAT